ncbi:hypothetical protein JL721_8030 [Aureococcus anophagefferens]|nr:hypothetical protein JL721_8030 [Aureococcus anophagefferens]
MAGRAVHALRRTAAFAPRIDRRTLFAPRKAANPEALSLYRDILRASRHFHWADKEGEPWTRLVARMLVVGRECLDRTVRQFEEAQHRIQSKVENTRTR